MEIIKTPANLEGALGELIYVVSAPGQECADLEVLSSDGVKVLSVRRLSGSDIYHINTAGFVNAQIEVEPDMESSTGLVVKAGASARCSVRVGEQTSSESLHHAGTEPLEYLAPMSERTTGRMYEGGRDEVWFVADGSETEWGVTLYSEDGDLAICGGNVETIGDNVYAAVVDFDEVMAMARQIPGFGGEYGSLVLSVSADGVEFIRKEYFLEPSWEERAELCWLNPYGGLDRASFRVLGESLKADGGSVELPEGCRSTGGGVCEVFDLASPILSIEEQEWLSGIVRSPRVWMIRRGEVMPAVIESKELTRKAGELPQVELQIRTSRKATGYKL